MIQVGPESEAVSVSRHTAAFCLLMDAVAGPGTGYHTNLNLETQWVVIARGKLLPFDTLQDPFWKMLSVGDSLCDIRPVAEAIYASRINAFPQTKKGTISYSFWQGLKGGAAGTVILYNNDTEAAVAVSVEKVLAALGSLKGHHGPMEVLADREGGATRWGQWIEELHVRLARAPEQRQYLKAVASPQGSRMEIDAPVEVVHEG